MILDLFLRHSLKRYTYHISSASSNLTEAGSTYKNKIYLADMDDFVMLMPGTNLAGAILSLEKIRDHLSRCIPDFRILYISFNRFLA